MCILSGSDYLENLKGIGLCRAQKLLQSVKTSDVEEVSLFRV